MFNRRSTLKFGVAAAGSGALAKSAEAVPQSGLVFPDGYVPSPLDRPSPPARPFVTPLFVMPVAQPVSPFSLRPGPDPFRHQQFFRYRPQKFYVHTLSEFRWRYHIDGPYNQGSWAWGFNGVTPGPTFHAYEGEPIFVRRINNLPRVGTGNIPYALPSSTVHLHNAHTASESDGNPLDFTFPGEFWDHHYANFPAGNDRRERMNTLWYHDHRLDFTAPNVYAGLSGFYLLFDENDSNNENDRNPRAFRLPSGKYDVPLILHDVAFDENGHPRWDFANPHVVPNPEYPRGKYLGGPTTTNHGMLGDMFTVNRTIRPFFRVERRKYRFRVLNGGPSRLYRLFITKADGSNQPFFVVSTDGNLLPAPIVSESINVWPANRHDIVIDFSRYNAGDQLFLTNRLEMRPDGAGMSGRLLDQGDQIMRFDVVGGRTHDPSRIPDQMRALPDIDMSIVKRERTWDFDYDNGLWTVNGKLMHPGRIDAGIEQGTAEIWTIRNTGDNWAHPVHTHFEEFQILEINGQPVPPGSINKARRDMVNLGPGESIKFYGRWRDFLGRYVMHCHNVVHEDHSMMIQWKIVPPGQGF